jgi:hypothetical protein
MYSTTRLGLQLLLAVAHLCCSANEAPVDCHRADVDAHVRQQFSIYGPLSIDREYFGFIYLHEGAIGSAVVRGKACPNLFECGVNNSAAAESIPRGAKVLGEWHTHPVRHSATLSEADVKGAYLNRHIRCYVAFYGKPNGEVYAWDPQQTSVPTAMATRTLIGNFREKLVEATDEPVRYADSRP